MEEEGVGVRPKKKEEEEREESRSQTSQIRRALLIASSRATQSQASPILALKAAMREETERKAEPSGVKR